MDVRLDGQHWRVRWLLRRPGGQDSVVVIPRSGGGQNHHHRDLRRNLLAVEGSLRRRQPACSEIIGGLLPDVRDS